MSDSVVCECTATGFYLDRDPESDYYGMWVHVCGKPKKMYLDNFEPEDAQYVE